MKLICFNSVVYCLKGFERPGRFLNVLVPRGFFKVSERSFRKVQVIISLDCIKLKVKEIVYNVMHYITCLNFGGE